MKLLIMLLLMIASSAHAEIFKWIDSRGTAHYSNSVQDVPARYRSRVKALNMESSPRFTQPDSLPPRSERQPAGNITRSLPSMNSVPAAKARRERMLRRDSGGE